MSQWQIISLGITLVLFVMMSAFFSCAETALMAVNRYRLRHKARLKKRSAVRTLKLLKRPDRLLGTILIGNTFANMLASALATIIANNLWGEKGALITAVILTLIILIFAEITPKTLAALYPERVSRIVAYPIYVLLHVFYPIVWLANMVANGILKIARVNVSAQSIEPLSRDELRSIVYETSGRLSHQYQHMLLGILDLNKIMVEDVMVPAHEIEGIDIEKPWDVILEQIQNVKHEWIPVYREEINQLAGVLSIPHLSRILLSTHSLTKEILLNALQEPYFVPEGKPLHIQLSHFQSSRKRIAFVVDEYGDILGLITLRDIVEEIVGEFRSSVASVSKRIEKQGDESFIADGAVTVREFNRVSQFELPIRGPRTLNGLIVEYLEALPKAGTCVLIKEYPVEIIDVKDNRVKSARIFPKLSKEEIS